MFKYLNIYIFKIDFFIILIIKLIIYNLIIYIKTTQLIIMETKYTKINKKIIKGEILINTRKTYIDLISKDFLINKIIPIEYIDNHINLSNFNKGILNNIINDEQRLKFIYDLLIKECIKGTSHLISDMCS
jgi:hypothetical protein